MADVVAWWVGPRRGVVHEDATEQPAGSPGYGVFRTADGRWIALGVLAEQRLWTAICAALDLPDLAPLTFAARLARTDEINAAVASRVEQLDEERALARLVECGAPVTPVLEPEEATAHPQLVARGFHVATDAGVVAALPVRVAGDGVTRSDRIAALDADRDGFAPR
jgi:crotonobetainyl-CoA:carnitine CoA-transferase CaiB-like acyl-CoA transferase